MKPIFYFFALLVILSTSCGRHSAEYQRLQAQNDSLMNAKIKLQQEVDGYFTAMNQIEQNIEKIKDTEKIISIQPVGKDLSEDVRTKINEDMTYLYDMLKTNKEELARLKSKIRRSAFRSSQLEQTIVKLTKSLEEETQKVTQLQAELLTKDSLILKLDTQVTKMGRDIENLKVETKTKDVKIKELDETIHTAWYVFGTIKELRQQKIVSSEGMFTQQRVLQHDFNKNYFVRIDARNTKSIPLYSNHAKILTNHPKSSYTLEKENGNFVLLIVDPDEFWSISKYLVIEVE